ncbi:scavenger receptor class F member 1-like [Haliotis rufescens]|uniref:scavenger receptor class F member 1-like n=1 Tax=Haliotis rufescens TaxID=6454 RepID=UPI00201F9DDD|nr:scavenger receptor class F member 1-like [Haliotis rufescens]XP_048246965.1 scavenger receptor class F member 1-like [Haliotis rufescens]
MGGTEKSQKKSEYLFSLLLVIITPLFANECPQCLHNDCDSTGLCIKGCKTGFADKYCQYVCPETCQQSRCEVGATGAVVCSLGCIDGYHGPWCNIPCADGYKHCSLSQSNGSSECKTNRYGNHCQHSCEDTCRGFACDDQGLCLSTCTGGRFGANCSLTCREHQQSCQQNSGHCVACNYGYYGDVCEKACPSCLPVWEDKVQRCKPGCTICTEEDKENTGTPTFYWEQEARVVTTVSLAISAVSLIQLSIICVYLLRRNCGTTSRSDEYKNTDIRYRHWESKSEDTPGENESMLNQID